MWSRIRKRYKELLADCLQGRVDVHATEYGKQSGDIGRGWITLDGREVVSVMIPSHWDSQFNCNPAMMDFGEAVGALIQMDIVDAKGSADPLIAALVFLDRRVGKSYLNGIDELGLHPFSQALFRVRIEAEAKEH